MRVGISVVLRWMGVFCLLAAMAAQQKVLAGGQARASGSGISATSKTLAEPDSPAAQGPATASAQPGPDDQASVPRLIKFSGILLNLAGKPIAGPVDVTFSLYSDEAGGAPLWFETQTVQADSLGRYTVLLGAMTSAGIPMELFTSGEAHWLGVQVSSLPEQARVLLVSVPYALKSGDAETLGGRPASSYQLAPESDSTSGKGAKQGTITTRGAKSTIKTSGPTPQVLTATQNYIPKMTDNSGSLGNSVIYQNSSRIGIGTTLPAYGLDINANVIGVGTTVANPGFGGSLRYRDDTGTPRWLFGLLSTAGATNFIVNDLINHTQPLIVQPGAPTNSFFIRTGGDIGIGTASPQYLLDVNGNVIALGTTAPRAGFGGTLRFRDDTGTPRWLLGLPGTAGATLFHINDMVNSHEVFVIEAGTPAGAMTIKSTGNIGMGTTNPGARLEVNGTAKFDQGVTFQQPVTFASSQNFGSSTTIITASTATLSGNTANQVLSATQAGTGAVAVLNNTTGGKILVGQNNGLEKFSVDGSGNLTIQGAFSGDGSLLSKLDPTKLDATLGAATINLDGDGITTGRAVFAINAGGAGTFAGKQLTDFPLLGLANTFEDTQTIDIGDLNVNNGKLSIGSGNLLLSSGKVGVGTATPDGALHVITTGTSASGLVQTKDAIGAECSVDGCSSVDAINTGTNGFGLFAKGIGSGSLAGKFVGSVDVSSGGLTVSGNIGIGTTTPGKVLDVIGDIRTSTCFLAGATTIGGTCSSDARLKTNIRAFAPVLDRVARLQPVRFNWRVKEFPDYHFLPGEGFGLIAQDVEKVFPDMVSTDEHGYRKLNYNELPYLMLESIRELKTRNDSLHETVQGQRIQIEQARAALVKLGQANAEKDARIEALRFEVETLRKAQQDLASFEARLALLEAKAGASRYDKKALASSAHKTRKPAHTEVARVGF